MKHLQNLWAQVPFLTEQLMELVSDVSQLKEHYHRATIRLNKLLISIFSLLFLPKCLPTPRTELGTPFPEHPVWVSKSCIRIWGPALPHMQASILAWILINIINHYSANIFTFAFNAQRNLVENVIILMLPMKNQGPEELIYPKSQSQWVAELGPKFSSDSHSCLLVRLVVQQHCPIELSVMIEMFYICTVCMVATSQMRLWAHVASTAKDLNLFILLNFN